MSESEEELKSLLKKVKEESEKDGLKLNIQKIHCGIQCHNFMANRWGDNGNSDGHYFLGLQITLTVTAAMKLKDVWSWKESYDKSRQHVKKQRLHFAYKGPYSQSYGFSSSHVWMWELDHEKGLALKNWETLERPLDFKEMKPVNPKGNQPLILIKRTDAEAEAPILWPPGAKS